MPDGGVYVLSIPKAPYRCPPGPYERVCQVASYLKAAKPRSKIIVLDANPDIQSKKGLFLASWNGAYAGMIEYRVNSQVTEVDARNNTAVTELGDRVKANVLNIVPPQGAGSLRTVRVWSMPTSCGVRLTGLPWSPPPRQAFTCWVTQPCRHLVCPSLAIWPTSMVRRRLRLSSKS